MRSTYITKPADIERKWFVVDASGKTLGRLASEVAIILKGKHKPIYAPNVDAGDYIIVVNAKEVRTTGNKLDKKLYFRHSGWAGGDKYTSLRVMFDKKPEQIIYHAVKGMLPKNVLGRQMFRKLHVYAGPEHPHEAQRPEPLEIDC